MVQPKESEVSMGGEEMGMVWEEVGVVGEEMGMVWEEVGVVGEEVWSAYGLRCDCLHAVVWFLCGRTG